MKELYMKSNDDKIEVIYDSDFRKYRIIDVSGVNPFEICSVNRKDYLNDDFQVNHDKLQRTLKMMMRGCPKNY